LTIADCFTAENAETAETAEIFLATDCTDRHRFTLLFSTTEAAKRHEEILTTD
jgi:hypothetical protein